MGVQQSESHSYSLRVIGTKRDFVEIAFGIEASELEVELVMPLDAAAEFAARHRARPLEPEPEVRVALVALAGPNGVAALAALVPDDESVRPLGGEGGAA